VGNTPILANWVQNDMGKIFKTIKVDDNNFNFFEHKKTFFM